jgi:hypothetical protein
MCLRNAARLSTIVTFTERFAKYKVLDAGAIKEVYGLMV